MRTTIALAVLFLSCSDRLLAQHPETNLPPTQATPAIQAPLPFEQDGSCCTTPPAACSCFDLLSRFAHFKCSHPTDCHSCSEHDSEHESFWDRRRGFADKHAPAGIMGAHVHEKGEIMVEYKYMNMYMDGNRFGTQRLSDLDALRVGQSLGTNKAATPTDMTMQMSMLHFMYGLTDDVTIYTMVMLPSFSMDHLRNTPFMPNPPLSGTTFTTSNSGFGDLFFGALWRVYNSDQDEVIINISGSAPTGQIDRLTTIPTGGKAPQEFPYPMRLGSGTFNFRPGITYKHFFCKGSFGSQLQTDLPIGRNYDGYAVSNSFRFSNWYAHLLTERLALSLRVENLWLSNFSGADRDTKTTNPGAISTNRPDMRGGYWLNLGYGVAAIVGNGHLLNVEVVQPICQDLNGIQLETDWMLAVSWSKAF